MALFHYLKQEPNNHCSSLLTKPDGPLSDVVPAASIVHVAVNKEMKQVLLMSSAEDLQLCDTQGKKCGRYNLFSPNEKVQIGKRAAEHSITVTLRHYCNAFSVYCVHVLLVCVLCRPVHSLSHPYIS